MAAQVRRWKTDEPHLRFVLLGFVGGFLLFTGRHTFGPLVALMPFSYSLPFHRFYVQFHFFAILLAGWGMVELHRRVVDKLSALWSDARGGTEETRIDRRNVVALVMFLVMMAFFVPYVQQGYRESTFHIRNLEAQRADLDGWWGVGTAEFMDYITAAQETLPGTGRAWIVVALFAHTRDACQGVRTAAASGIGAGTSPSSSSRCECALPLPTLCVHFLLSLSSSRCSLAVATPWRTLA